MEKLLFNINSTSFFPKWRNGKYSKFEIFYVLMALACIPLAAAITYEGSNHLGYGPLSKWLSIPFLIFWTQYIVYAVIKSKIPLEVEDHFWKTQLWRFMDPGYNFQKSLHPNPILKLKQLRRRWLFETGVTVDFTIHNSPWIQKGRVIILLGSFFIGVLIGLYIL
jgi:hypothetical protein